MDNIRNIKDINFLSLEFNDDVLRKLKSLPEEKASDIVASALFETVEIEINFRPAKNIDKKVVLEANLYQASKLQVWFNWLPLHYQRKEKHHHLTPGQPFFKNIESVLTNEDKRDLLDSELLLAKVTERNLTGHVINTDLVKECELGIGDELSFEDAFNVFCNPSFDFFRELKKNAREKIASVAEETVYGFSMILKDMYDTLGVLNSSQKEIPIALLEVVAQQIPSIDGKKTLESANGNR